MPDLTDYIPAKTKKPDTTTCSFRIKPETRERLDALHEEMGVSRVTIIHALIDRQYDEMFEAS